MNEKLPPLELWLPDIKKYVFEFLQQSLSPFRFQYRKPDGSFRREHGKNYEEFSILFANQFPVNYRLSFLLEIWNNEVKQVKSAFPGQASIENYKMRSLVLFMNYFVIESSAEPDPIHSNDYLLVTNKDLFLAMDNLNRVILDQAMPLADQMSGLDGLDSFFSEHPGWSVDNLNFNNITTELIVARLNRKRDFKKLFEEMMHGIDQKIADLEMSADTRETIERLYSFLITKY